MIIFKINVNGCGASKQGSGRRPITARKGHKGYIKQAVAAAGAVPRKSNKAQLGQQEEGHNDSNMMQETTLLVHSSRESTNSPAANE